LFVCSELMFFTTEIYFAKSIESSHHLKTTKSSANFLSPEPNGHCYNIHDSVFFMFFLAYVVFVLQ